MISIVTAIRQAAYLQHAAVFSVDGRVFPTFKAPRPVTAASPDPPISLYALSLPRLTPAKAAAKFEIQLIYKAAAATTLLLPMPRYSHLLRCGC
jgi:hypothetical protein